MSLEFGFSANTIINEGRVTAVKIEAIKIWLNGNQNLPKLTDEQIVHFLASCENDQNRAQQTIETYYSIRNGNSHLFNNRKLTREDLKKTFDTITVCMLPERTDDGYAIVLTLLQDANYRNYNFESYMIQLYMILDAVNYGHPPKGLIIIFDMKGMSLMHLLKMKFALLRIFFVYLQEALPLCLKAAHMFNCIYFLDKVMYVMKPFIKDEVWKMAKFHHADIDMDRFYENYIPKRCLPKEYGGDLPPIRVLREKTINKLMDLQGYFEAEEAQRRGHNSVESNFEEQHDDKDKHLDKIMLTSQTLNTTIKKFKNH